jgi:hypothetical protein
MATYDRPVRGADVAGAAATVPGVPVAPADVLARIAPDAEFADLEALRAALPPAALGVTAGVWEALFAPLFGEFE